MIEMLNSTWHEWNNVKFWGLHNQIPLYQILTLAITHVKSLINCYSNECKKRIWSKELQLLE